MSPESQRIAIAEAHLGGKFYFESGTFYRWHTEECPQPFSRLCKEGGWLVRVELLDYLNDLNAMHEAEKLLTDEQWEFEYENWLSKITYRTIGDENARGNFARQAKHRRLISCATAAQRAEAFLRCLSLRKEGE